MNKLETVCIQCGADRVYTHHNYKTSKWTVYCATCCDGYASEEEAVDAYMRVYDTAYIRGDLVDRMREACKAVVEAFWYEDEYDGNKVCDCAMCTAYRMARAALEEVNDE